jgi:hypothetical protein
MALIQWGTGSAPKKRAPRASASPLSTFTGTNGVLCVASSMTLRENPWTAKGLLYCAGLDYVSQEGAPSRALMQRRGRSLMNPHSNSAQSAQAQARAGTPIA